MLDDIDRYGNIKVEFLLEQFSKIETIHVNDVSDLDSFLKKYINDYKKGLSVQTKNEQIRKNYNMSMFKRDLDNLKKIWKIEEEDKENKAVKNSKPRTFTKYENNKGQIYDLIYNINELIVKNSIDHITLSQIRTIEAITQMVSELSKIQGFDRLKEHLGTQAGLDDQFFATYFYSKKHAVKKIEHKIKHEGNQLEFDADFSYLICKTTYFIQVKSLKNSPRIRAHEQSLIYHKIRQQLNRKHLDEFFCEIDGFMPESKINNINWEEIFEELDITKQLQIDDVTISFTKENKASWSGINYLQHFQKNVWCVSKKVPPIEQKDDDKYICLFVVEWGVISQLEEYRRDVNRVLGESKLDGIFFLEYARNGGNGDFLFNSLELLR